MHLFQSILALVGVFGVTSYGPRVAAAIFRESAVSSDHVYFFSFFCVLIAQKFFL